MDLAGMWYSNAMTPRHYNRSWPIQGWVGGMIDYEYINLSPSQFWLQLRRVDLGGRTHGDSVMPRFDARPWHDDIRMQVAAYETRSERERKSRTRVANDRLVFESRCRLSIWSQARGDSTRAVKDTSKYTMINNNCLSLLRSSRRRAADRSRSLGGRCARPRIAQ